LMIRRPSFLMIRRPPRSTQGVSSAASDVYKRQKLEDTKKALDEQVKSAITEFQNVQPTNEKMTDLQDTK
ncbi:hypothetical protein, partial [Staphylococcus aureus]